MTELEIMKRAQMYIESLAKGIDPLTGAAVSENDIIQNVRISRCLFYVSDVLQKVIDNGGEINRPVLKKSDKLPFSLTEEQADALLPTASRLSASKIVSYINSLIETDKMSKLTSTSVVSWLFDAGLLCEITTANGKVRKVPTADGQALGIQESEFMDEGNVRKYVSYDKNAQQFIFDNIAAIAEVCQREAEQKELLKIEKAANKGKPWTEQEEQHLLEMYDSGCSVKSISNDLKRSSGAVKARLIKLGRIETDTL